MKFTTLHLFGGFKLTRCAREEVEKCEKFVPTSFLIPLLLPTRGTVVAVLSGSVCYNKGGKSVPLL